MPALMLILWACSNGEPAPAPTTDAFLVHRPTADTSIQPADTGPLGIVSAQVLPAVTPKARLVRRLMVSSNVPATATLTLRDGEAVRDITFLDEEPNTTFDLPLLGLRPGPHEVTVTLTGDGGNTATAALSFDVPPIEEPLPDIVLRSGSAGAANPGLTLMAAWSPDIAEWLLAVDGQGRVVWAFETPGDPKNAVLWPDGLLTSIPSHNVSVRGIAGEFVALYSDNDVEGATPVDDEFHHDAYFPGDGTFWSLRSEPVAIDAYPLAPDDLTTLAPATVLDDLVVHHGADGTLLGEWSMIGLLDPTRVGYGSHDVVGDTDTFDWSHANAVLPIDEGAAFLVSLRHQDAIVKIDASSSEVVWLLGNPDGWSGALASKRLQPVGALEWPYHAHGVKLDGDTLYLFDNGNNHRATPYTQEPHPDGLFSRLVGYRIDEEAGTVEQVVDLRPPDGPLFARALGNVQPLPDSGHLLGTYSYLAREHGVSNEAMGRGTQSTRILEWDLASRQIVWDLSLSGAPDAAPKGWLVDRATRIPSLYLGIAEETYR